MRCHWEEATTRRAQRMTTATHLVKGMGHTQNRISYTNIGARYLDFIATRHVYGKFGRPKRNGLEPDAYGIIV